MASRKLKLWLTEEWKEKIRISMLLNRLQNHAAGRIEMTPTQVRAAEVLLRKVAPDQTETIIQDRGNWWTSMVQKATERNQEVTDHKPVESEDPASTVVH